MTDSNRPKKLRITKVEDLRDPAIEAVLATAREKGDQSVVVLARVALTPLTAQSGPFIAASRERARIQVMTLVNEGYLGIPEHVDD